MVLVVLCVVPGDGGKAIYQVSRVHVHLHPMVPMDHLGSKLTRVAQGTSWLFTKHAKPHDHPGGMDPQITFGTNSVLYRQMSTYLK